jgi:hypothetical protein
MERKFLFYDRWEVISMETRRNRTARSGVSGAGLLVGLAILLVVLGLLTTAHTVLSLVLLGVGFGALAVAGWLWGADSTDGSSWSRHETGQWR